ncbi:MAG: LCP family protein [Gaiellaceae bacterium]
MPAEEKPYRVYRAGRVKGNVPTLPKAERSAPRRAGTSNGRYTGPGPARPRKRRRYRRYLLGAVLLLLVLLVAWAVTSYLAVRSGVETANGRLGQRARATLMPQEGSLLTSVSYVLLLGTDSAPGREGLRHSDSIMLLRTDPDHNRMSYLSIPRDLRVEVPGHGSEKVNVAFQIGGAPLAVRTVRDLGLPVNHVVIVDMRRFGELIDAVGGVTVDVPRPILSKFECPLKTTEQCTTWPGWRFRKGPQEMNGRRARIYARVRKNQLDPAESDITRAARQQQIMQALTHEMTSLGTIIRLPWMGEDLAKPLATDLSAGELLELGWRRFRTGEESTLHCRLGGTPSGGYLLPEADDIAEVISMFTGRSASQPPAPGQPYAGGCRLGRTLLATR